jgi:hypothetical protein
VRGGQLVPITGDTKLQAADDVLVLAPPRRARKAGHGL